MITVLFTKPLQKKKDNDQKGGAKAQCVAQHWINQNLQLVFGSVSEQSVTSWCFSTLDTLFLMEQNVHPSWLLSLTEDLWTERSHNEVMRLNVAYLVHMNKMLLNCS